MARYVEPDELRTGVRVSNLPTCVFPAKPYPRVVTGVNLGNSVPSSVTFYRGLPDTGGQVAFNSFGVRNTMRGEIRIPAGQTFIVQWSVLGPNYRDAFATVSWAKEDSLDPQVDSLASAIYWETVTEPTEDVGRILANLGTTSIPGATFYGPYYVGNQNYIQVTARSAVNMNIEMFSFADPGLTAPVGLTTIRPVLNQDVRQNVPVIGPYIQFLVQLSAYPNNIIFRVVTVTEPVGDTFPFASNILLSVDGTAVPGVSVGVFDATNTRGGLIHWNAFFDTGAASLQRLYAVDFNGNQTLIACADNGNASPGALALAPALPLRLVVNNADAVARNLFAVVTHHPYHP